MNHICKIASDVADLYRVADIATEGKSRVATDVSAQRKGHAAKESGSAGIGTGYAEVILLN